MVKDDLEGRMLKDYKDMTDFIKRSRIPLAPETVRRVISLKIQEVATPTLMIVYKYLGYSANEIRQMLLKLPLTDERDRTLARDFAELIGDQPRSEINEREKAMIEICRMIEDKNLLADQLSLVAKAEGADISRQTDRIRKPKR